MNLLLKNRKLFFCSLSSLLLLALLTFFHFRGVTYYDEGYILNAALRTAHGEIPYKDFDMVYTPLSFLLTSGFLKIFGESVFIGRLAAFTVSLFSLMALFLLLKHFTKNMWLIFGSLLFFTTWGPTHINFPWPTMFAICFFLYAMLFYLYGINKNPKINFFIAGVMTFLVFLSKQNFGVGVFFALLIAYFFFRHKKKHILYYLSGFAAPAGVYGVYLIATASAIPFVENMYIYTLKRIMIDKGLETPFLYEGSLLARGAKLIFYTFPVSISLIAFVAIIKKQKKLVFIPLAIAVFYFLGIRPTTDYVHVSPLLAITCLPLVLIYLYLKKQYTKPLIVFVFVSLIALGFYTAYFKGYYQWEEPLKNSSHFISNQRLKIYLPEKEAKNTQLLVDYIESRTKPNEYIFVNYYTPLVYFITDRKNPTPYDLINTDHLPVAYQKNIIKILEEKQVRTVLFHDINKNENSLVSNYIRKEYPYQKIVGAYVVYEKK